MESTDPLLVRLWVLAFRTLCLGALLTGALAMVVGVIVAASALLPRTQPSPSLSIGYGVVSIALGIIFAVIGVSGLKMRTRLDVDAEISKTSSDRDMLERWINR
jgi:hypothetical protein